jgi:hypothetical protein
MNVYCMPIGEDAGRRYTGCKLQTKYLNKKILKSILLDAISSPL